MACSKRGKILKRISCLFFPVSFNFVSIFLTFSHENEKARVGFFVSDCRLFYLFHCFFDLIYRILYSYDLLSLVVVDLNIKLLFDPHNDLENIEGRSAPRSSTNVVSGLISSLLNIENIRDNVLKFFKFQ